MRGNTWHGRARRTAALAIAVVTAVLAPATPAAASPEADMARPVVQAPVTPAAYEGRTIDLGRDWQGARACAVWAPGDVRCYDSAAAMVADEAGPQAGARALPDLGALALGDCPSGALTNEWFCLFEHANHGGRMLKFKSPNVCQSLAAYGFDNQASSWANTLGDRVRVYDNLSCGSTELLFTANPHASAATIGADNRAGSIRIVR